MKVNIKSDCFIFDLPEPIREAAINALELQKKYVDIKSHTVNSINWSSTLEYVIDKSFWANVYQGRLTQISPDILKLWNYKELNKIEINNIKPRVYTAKSKNKVYEITIKEIKNVKI